MSRDEARKRLQGTFSFKMDGGKVIINDEALLREIHDLMANSPEYLQSTEWAAPDSIARPVSFGAAA